MVIQKGVLIPQLPSTPSTSKESLASTAQFEDNKKFVSVISLLINALLIFVVGVTFCEEKRIGKPLDQSEFSFPNLVQSLPNLIVFRNFTLHNEYLKSELMRS